MQLKYHIGTNLIMETIEESDLPLLSNIDTWRARHYLIKLSTNVTSRLFDGQLIIFLSKPTICELSKKNCSYQCNHSDVKTQYESKLSHIILECNNIEIKSIFKITASFSESSLRSYNDEAFDFWNSFFKEDLKYEKNDWSVTIECTDEPTQIIYINYCTQSIGQSISWKCDEDRNFCCFTSGSAINNRSLLPYQDRPFAMSTWQAWITVPKLYYVSMTGDSNPITKPDLSNDICFYYYTSMVLPLSTIAIAIGQWEVINVVSNSELQNLQAIDLSVYKNISCKHEKYSCQYKKNIAKDLIPVTYIVTKSMKEKINHLIEFTKVCLKRVSSVLGPHPFERLEIVILPRSFSSLGLASPNLIFLSKVILIDDSSSCIRIAHEISHSWFGITIGPRNWNDEWLSEGFATFVEDIFYIISMEEYSDANKSNFSHTLDKHKDFFCLRSHLRYKTLIAELQNSDVNLQILSSSSTSSTDSNMVKNGLNADKAFLQVHYLKGYFFLLYLSGLVTPTSFLHFLFKFVTNFHGLLISSNDVIDYFFDNFPQVNEITTKEAIFRDWFNTNQFNSEFANRFNELPSTNALAKAALSHFQYWTCLIKKKKTSITKLDLLSNFKLKYSDQIILIFEWLLDVPKIPKTILKQIYNIYYVPSRCSEIRHRWCELVIKHNYSNLNDVKEFLVEDQSMGVYLYGELMISGKQRHKVLAQDTYKLLKDELDNNTKNVICSMIFGTT